MNPPPKIMLYRFLPARYAVQAIESLELRVGRLAELNDPFEFFPALPTSPLTDQTNALRNEALLKSVNPSIGILCFSTAPNDPVVWSHYSEGHHGIALGFEYVHDENVNKVEYPKTNLRPVFDVDLFIKLKATGAALDEFKKVLKTKAPSWGYEKEYRTFPDLEKCTPRGGMYFQTFERILLKVVMPGCRCSISDNYLKHALKAGQIEAAVRRAHLHETEFVVGHRSPMPPDNTANP